MLIGGTTDAAVRRTVEHGVGWTAGGMPERSTAALRDHYEPMGPEVAGMVAGSALRTPEAVQGALQAYEAAGVDELVLDTTARTRTRSTCSPRSASGAEAGRHGHDGH